AFHFSALLGSYSHSAQEIRGQHIKQLIERAHALHLPKLIPEILERELVASELLLKLERFILIDFGLNLLDQREHIAHSQNSLRDAIRIKRLDRIVAFAYADELNRLAGDFLDRKRRASPAVAFHLAQDHARQPDLIVKLLRGSHGVLSGHRVGDKQNLRRHCLRFDLFKLDHQLFVDVQASGSVDEQGVVAGQFAFAHGLAAKLQRVVNVGRFEHRVTNLICDDGQLLASGGTIYVYRDEKRSALLRVRKKPGEFSGCRRLTGTL